MKFVANYDRYDEDISADGSEENLALHLEYEREQAQTAIQRLIASATYPCYGYTTADVITTEDDYRDFLETVLDEELEELTQYWRGQAVLSFWYCGDDEISGDPQHWRDLDAAWDAFTGVFGEEWQMSREQFDARWEYITPDCFVDFPPHPYTVEQFCANMRNELPYVTDPGIRQFIQHHLP